jgi:aminoglycoside phosphotransferase (APT) family kinase protein
MTDIADALTRAGFPADSPTTRLAGLTNVNHLLEHEGTRYVLRIPGAGTSEYISRTNEEVAARSASAAGVNAEVVFFDATDGLMVTRFVEGAATMNAERFLDLDACARAGRAFRELHTRATPFATDFDLFGMIDEYKAARLEGRHAAGGVRGTAGHRRGHPLGARGHCTSVGAQPLRPAVRELPRHG